MTHFKETQKTSYTKYLDHIANQIASIGKEKTKESPAIIGLSNIENENVLIDLLETKALKNEKYDYVHIDSEDWMGRDLALLYKTKYFSIIDYQLYSIKQKNNIRLKTHGVLHIQGKFEEETIHIILNHWEFQKDKK